MPVKEESPSLTRPVPGNVGGFSCLVSPLSGWANLAVTSEDQHPAWVGLGSGHDPGEECPPGHLSPRISPGEGRVCG